MNLKNIKFTVLLPILDREDIVKGFSKALESIYKNSLKPDQVLVTVDGPVSKSFKKIIEQNETKYSLDVVWSEKKIGLDKALNLGLTKSKNEFIFRADGDDINIKNRFEMQLPYLLSGYDVVGSCIDEYDEDGKYITSKEVPLSNKDIKSLVPFRNPINHMTVGYLKTSVLEVDGYPELFLKGDYGLWIKLLSKNKKFINLEQQLVKVTAGSRMIRDRGGLRYIYSEFILQKYLLEFKLTNILNASIVFILRTLIFSLPAIFRTYIYKNFLKKKN